MDEEKAKLLPKGALLRIVKPAVAAKERGFTTEFWLPFNKTVCTFAIALAEAAAEKADLDNRTGITVKHLMSAGEKLGVKIEI
jgi:histone H3/H4